MVKYYRTDDSRIHEEEKIDSGVWIHMVDPTAEDAFGGFFGYRRGRLKSRTRRRRKFAY